jgi:uncharacterized protein (DUF2267 family)
MECQRWVEEVQRRTGLATPELAKWAIEATLGVLRQRLLDDEAAALAGALPEPFAGLVRGGAYDEDFGVEELYRRVHRREGVHIGFAAEHAQAVFQVLAEEIDGEILARLRRHLPADYAALLEPRPPHSTAGEPPPTERRAHGTPPGEGSTLADGRLGSRHPLSEARPQDAHQESVARSDNPHGETKISSSHGLTQERRDDTLAAGTPGSSRPIHSAR